MTSRERVLEHITKNPGITFRKLAQELEMGIGNLQYHLRHLEREKKIVAKKLGGRKYIFPADFSESYKPLMIAISNESQRKILILLAEDEKNQHELAEKLNLTPSTINYHMERLEALGLVRKIKHGKNVIYQPNYDKDVLIRIIREYKPKIWDRLADKLIDLTLTFRGEEYD
ncbi:regulatory protein [Thermococcus sp. EP1]|uniref:winged helix-turn-helix transcriptional regulator n=1 Tax=Thermococcus sp. EP1 TaxID=1591054 RepID=UPI0006D9728D|nr:winged helix-turn-helix transcriptional regulator [Thermococcus sp. EP1]KPU63333.1 regulatory protein [Thermococcus sp. EP1]